MVGGIGSFAVVEVSSIGFAGYHATLQAVCNTVYYWVEIAGFHRSCEMPQWYGPPAIGGIHLCGPYFNKLVVIGHRLYQFPQLQEDNTVASTHNFYDATTILPYNKQYYTQGGRDGQPARWIPPQQPQAQPRQPYTYSQP
ncbi:hypothetical protein PIB30_094069 [Stylosanthes scabra]|uniref:Uncharacterized protein n=1 Tax=Stylosanthes scabra TaxID=79078 RepID=A0ABU6SWN3_9FABA|nr:hypothetical protein [Stylosanthes scabra]